MNYIVQIENAPSSTTPWKDLQQAQIYFAATVLGYAESGDYATNVILKEVGDKEESKVIVCRYPLNETPAARALHYWADTFM